MPAPRSVLTLATLREHVREHCFAPTQRRLVGVEWEVLTFPMDDPKARPAVADLEAVATTVLPGGSAITLEPGGQMEVSSTPQVSLAAALVVAAADVAALSTALRRRRIAPVALGRDPLRPPQRILRHPRYEAMEAFFETVEGGRGPAGRTMMCSTASIQVNLEVGGPGEVSRRWRLVHAVAPVLCALFAHSPHQRAGGRVASARQANWAAMDPLRTAAVHEPDGPRCDPADEWLGYALAAPVMLVRHSAERFSPVVIPLSFAQWMTAGHAGHFPTLDDFDYHSTTLFPPVRPRGWLELRMLDSLPDPWLRVAVAVTTATLDDAATSEVAERATVRTGHLWPEAALSGMSHPVLRQAGEAVFRAALDALPRLGVDSATLRAAEAFFDRFVVRGRSPADEPLAALPGARRTLAQPA